MKVIEKKNINHGQEKKENILHSLKKTKLMFNKVDL